MSLQIWLLAFVGSFGEFQIFPLKKVVLLPYSPFLLPPFLKRKETKGKKQVVVVQKRIDLKFTEVL